MLRSCVHFGIAARCLSLGYHPSPPDQWHLSVLRALRSRLHPKEGGQMSDPGKFDIRQWIVPPLLVPIFLLLLVAVAAVL